MEIALSIVTGLASIGAVIAALLAARWSREASKAQGAAALRSEHGITFRWACELAASGETERARQMGISTLAAMEASGTLSDEEKRLLFGAGQALLGDVAAIAEAYPDQNDTPVALTPSGGHLVREDLHHGKTASGVHS